MGNDQIGINTVVTENMSVATTVSTFGNPAPARVQDLLQEHVRANNLELPTSIAASTSEEGDMKMATYYHT